MRPYCCYRTLSLSLLALFPATHALAGPLTQPPDSPLHCVVEGETVRLSWQIAFFAPIERWFVDRGGETIAVLEPEASSFVDEFVADGEHHYSLTAVNFDGSAAALAECHVVKGDFGMTCSAEGLVAQLDWGPILIDIHIDQFDVYRDGHRVATLPADVTRHADPLPAAGRYRYHVRAVTAPGEDFLLGACTVHALEELACRVKPPFVELDWSAVPLPEFVIAFFVVVRDDAIVGTTNDLHFLDQPGPGAHSYRVFAVSGALARDDLALSDLIAAYLIGECNVVIPIDRVPPPRNLVCNVVYPLPAPFPEPFPLPLPDDTLGVGIIEAPADDGAPADFLPPPSVVLSWHNPIDYDHLIVARNSLPIAFLDGNAQSFVDESVFLSGPLIYEVVGVLLDRKSEPSACDVEIPPSFTPPPRDLFCEVLGHLSDPIDPAGKLAVPPELDIDEVGDLPIVRLTWHNPISYRAVFVSRDNGPAVELSGTAMLYHDFRPRRGEVNSYRVWGVGHNGRASRRVRCDVFVPPRVVPPVTDLRCRLLDTQAAGPAVSLAWANSAPYDRLSVRRDHEILATLEGGATGFIDHAPPPGVRHYEVIAQIGDRRSPPVGCRVVVPGPPDDLLFFSSSLARDAVTDEAFLPPEGTGRITCLASHGDGLQGWSFGVCSDPSLLMVDDATIAGTNAASVRSGAGPSFLHIDRQPEGVTMAAIVDESDPNSTLPPAGADSLLQVQYSPGPDAVPLGHYPVRYCDALGSPAVAVLYVVGGFEKRPETLPGSVVLPGPLPPFLLRGDVNGDDVVSMADAVKLLNWLFLGGEEPGCREQADINRSGEISLADAVYELQWEFAGGPPPPSPFPDCGPFETELGCEEPSCPQPVF